MLSVIFQSCIFRSCIFSRPHLPPGRGDIPALTPAEAGTRLSDPGGMQGWVDLVDLVPLISTVGSLKVTRPTRVKPRSVHSCAVRSHGCVRVLIVRGVGTILTLRGRTFYESRPMPIKFSLGTVASTRVEGWGDEPFEPTVRLPDWSELVASYTRMSERMATNIGLLYPKVHNNIGGIFPLTSPNQNIGGMCPRHPRRGWRQWDEYLSSIFGRHLTDEPWFWLAGCISAWYTECGRYSFS